MKTRKKASAKPLRRKAERKTGKKPSKTILIKVEAQEMRVEYTPNYFAGQGHFEFRSPYSPSKGIPISETGYLSYFAPMELVEAAASPEAFSQTVVQLMMTASQKGDRQKIDSAQLSLF